MITNRYYILPYPNQNNSLWDIVVGDESTQRMNNQGDKIVVKLAYNDTKQHAILSGIKEYTQAEILQYLNDNASSWSEQII